MLHQVRQSDLCFAKGTIFSTDSLVTRFTNSTCSFSTSAHSNCTAAMFGNASGLRNASRRVLKSVKKAELWDGSFGGAKAAAPDHARNAQRQRGDCLQNPVVGPVFVFVEQLNVTFSHSGGWLTQTPILRYFTLFPYSARAFFRKMM